MATEALEVAMQALAESGLLLLSDPTLPSVVGLVVDEPIHGSWWGHPLGGVIYRTSNALEDHPDVLATKLIAAKVTYVHRRLWPALAGVATAREHWQLDELSPGAQWLLRQVDKDGELQTNDLIPPTGVQRKKLPDFARELERRLLINATEIHTPTGAHAKVLETWQHWATRVEFATPTMRSKEGKRQLEEAATRLSGVTGARARLPWTR